jgi:hypothetical protein
MMMLVRLFFLPSLVIVASVIDCDRLSSSNRINADQHRLICSHFNQWHRDRQQLSPPKLTDRQRAYLDFISRCVGNECIEFRFEIDANEQQMDNSSSINRMIGSDWRCDHPEIAWRPQSCNRYQPKQSINVFKVLN